MLATRERSKVKRNIPEDRDCLLKMGISENIGNAEAEVLRTRYGTNLIAEHPPGSIAGLVRDTAADPMIWFLLGTSGLFGFLGQHADMAILLMAILPLVGMDFYLHRRTQASIEGLRSVLASTANVVRDGSVCGVAAEAVVPGDLVKVIAGESIPADGIIIAGDELQTEESSLTGEAYPISKSVHDGRTPPGEASWAFAGTRLLTGSADLRVIFTGTDTIFGEIVRSAVGGPPGRTPLQNAVGRLVRILLIASTVLCFLLAAVRLWQGFGPLDAFLSAATLAIAAIPEEFPVVLTFFLGVGVYRLARAKTLVRRSVAVENIGRVSVICSDKTGTITEGRLTYQGALPADGLTSDQLLELAAFASRKDSGDPLDIAIFEQAPSIAEDWSRTILFPFTEGRRRETACWRDRQGKRLVVTKGAPETILALCDISADMREDWNKATLQFSDQGQKVIACASKEQGDDPVDEPTNGFQFAGLIGISDPVRNGVREAVTEAIDAGIQVVMVTGDHPQTARAIANEVGIPADSLTILGDDLARELSRMGEDELKRLSVVARASPAQKVLLVEAFQGYGGIVAVTGDGVNDTPALRSADIGIAMGARGTRSAREVSAIVLMDDNFRTIISAISEGRQLFRNLRTSFAFLLMIHLPLVATAALIPFLGYPLLYLPAHIVWLELLIHPAAILAFQEGAVALSAEETARRDVSFFSAREWAVITGTGALIGAGVLVVFISTVGIGEPPEHARSMALVSLVLSLATLIILMARFRSVPASALAIAAAASSLVLVQWTPLAILLHLHPLPWNNWILAASIGAFLALGGLLFRRQARA